jgi:hypothetical protein
MTTGFDRRHAFQPGQNLIYGEINGEFGKPGAYTDAVELFMTSLDPAVKALLKP